MHLSAMHENQFHRVNEVNNLTGSVRRGIARKQKLKALSQTSFQLLPSVRVIIVPQFLTFPLLVL